MNDKLQRRVRTLVTDGCGSRPNSYSRGGGIKPVSDFPSAETIVTALGLGEGGAVRVASWPSERKKCTGPLSISFWMRTLPLLSVGD
jgi:hypothetical protein